tara:strand:- start:3984 stop:4904 length:921 start_codon:yes stop_codon:yes gene_type:complete
VSINFLIVGFGKIGAEHLKAIRKIKKQKTVWIYDDYLTCTTLSLKNDLIIKVNKINQIPKNKKIHFLIMSGLARDRYKLTKIILKRHSVNNILLEKMVFSKSIEVKKFIKSEFFKSDNIYVNTWSSNLLNKFNISFNNRKSFKIKSILPRENYLNNLCHLIEMFKFLIKKSDFLIISNKVDNLINVNNKYSICGGEIILKSDQRQMLIRSKKIQKGDIEMLCYVNNELLEKIIITSDFKLLHMKKKNKIFEEKCLKFPKIKKTTYKFINDILKKKKSDLTLFKDHSNSAYTLLKSFEKLKKKVIFK